MPRTAVFGRGPGKTSCPCRREGSGQKRQHDPRRDGRADDPGDVGAHGVHQEVVARVLGLRDTLNI